MAFIITNALGLFERAVNSKDDANLQAGESVTDDSIVIPIWAEPKATYYYDGGFHIEPKVPLIRAAAGLWHDALNSLSAILLADGRYYPLRDVDLAHDIIYGLHQMAYIVVKNTETNAQQKLAWFQAAVQGPTGFDNTNPHSYFDLAHSLTTEQRNAFREGPMSPVNASLERVNLATMISVNVLPYGSITEEPAPSDLRYGHWIDSITI